ncbi:hypothetical protein [Hyphomicrobium sp. D-2]|uniref:hypothetical protein n=1 Tax=Hyphomicrobium sp. D-2 TaxID=3041621 RepID=UPI002453CD7F|nr:hypothetical protein [Hyphomicrobium sp. D-2]MDH4983599.1 hypothetical protein [Hyphomicrobium sp. D-2]
MIERRRCGLNKKERGTRSTQATASRFLWRHWPGGMAQARCGAGSLCTRDGRANDTYAAGNHLSEGIQQHKKTYTHSRPQYCRNDKHHERLRNHNTLPRTNAANAAAAHNSQTSNPFKTLPLSPLDVQRHV